MVMVMRWVDVRHPLPIMSFSSVDEVDIMELLDFFDYTMLL